MTGRRHRGLHRRSALPGARGRARTLGLPDARDGVHAAGVAPVGRGVLALGLQPRLHLRRPGALSSQATRAAAHSQHTALSALLCRAGWPQTGSNGRECPLACFRAHGRHGARSQQALKPCAQIEPLSGLQPHVAVTVRS
jgi:hypothetical protein